MSEKAPKIFADPLDFDELFPGRFLKAGEFKDKKVTLTMTKIKLEELVGDKGAVVKGVVMFKETEKHWALNKTNGMCLRAMFGRQVQAWVGRRVTLYPGSWDGEQAIRVWGSPDIDKDQDVQIALPRKRPFNMMMHAMRKPAGPAAQTQSTSAAESEGAGGVAAADPTTNEEQPKAPTQARAIELLRGAKTLEALKDARRTIWGLYAAAQEQVPLDVEFAATHHRETLEQPS
jgi:hypothetical protein